MNKIRIHAKWKECTYHIILQASVRMAWHMNRSLHFQGPKYRPSQHFDQTNLFAKKPPLGNYHFSSRWIGKRPERIVRARSASWWATKRSAPAVRDDVLDWVGPPKSKQTKHTHTNRNVTKGFMTWFAFAVARGILTNGPYNHIVIILILLNTRRAPATRLGSISVHAASLAYRANTNIIRAFDASRSYLRARDGAHLAP